MATRLIDPDEILDFALDWSSFLEDAGSPTARIANSRWFVDPASGSPNLPQLAGGSIGEASTAVFVSGCERGEIYLLTNRVVTELGRTAERAITVRYEDK